MRFVDPKGLAIDTNNVSNEESNILSKEDEDLEHLSKVITGLSGIKGLQEIALYNKKYWLDLKTGSYRSIKFFGNQYTGLQTTTRTFSKAAKIFGRTTFIIGGAINIWEISQAHNLNQAVKPSLDLTMSAIATFGGTAGFAIGTAYYLLNNIGAFNSYEVKSSSKQLFNSPYKTKVFIPNIFK